MQVEDPLEDWLLHEVEAAVVANRSSPVLFVLAGNAGDGKSHLLFRLLRRRLASRADLLPRLRWIADATHALHPAASQRDRLVEFFGPFADEGATNDPRVHMIAMNTGMVIRFFEGEGEQRRFETLYGELQRQLGLRRQPGDRPTLPWREEVVNLDLRNLLAPDANGGPSFVERMLDRLSPASEKGIPASKRRDCEECPALALCPVAFNLQALQMPVPRGAVLTMLRRVALESDVHLSPRNLWGFLYRLVTGGVERYHAEDRASAAGACDVIRTRVASGDGAWLLAGQFSELLFQQTGAGTPWDGLASHDPAFSSAPAIDHLHTRLSIKTELDNQREVVEDQLGGRGQSLAGLALDALTAILPRGVEFKGRRRDAAVRRHVFFHQETLDRWLTHDGSREFARLLDAYRAYSTSPKDAAALSPEHRRELTELKKLVQEVFLHGNGRVVQGNSYLRVSQPNARATSELLVRADATNLDPIFNVQRIVAADVHIVAHEARRQLLGLLGYRPNQVTLDVLGVRVTIDLSLYDFLRRVNDGQKPSVRDMSQFQALLFIGERVGNALARQHGTKDLFVWEGTSNLLYCLGTDDFGQAHLTKARGNA
jgi:hypothetical protein